MPAQQALYASHHRNTVLDGSLVMIMPKVDSHDHQTIPMSHYKREYLPDQFANKRFKKQNSRSLLQKGRDKKTSTQEPRKSIQTLEQEMVLRSKNQAAQNESSQMQHRSYNAIQGSAANKKIKHVPLESKYSKTSAMPQVIVETVKQAQQKDSQMAQKIVNEKPQPPSKTNPYLQA